MAAARGDPEPEAIKTRKIEDRIETSVSYVLDVVLTQVEVSCLSLVVLRVFALASLRVRACVMVCVLARILATMYLLGFCEHPGHACARC